MSQYNVSSLKTLPVPQVQKFSNGTCGMRWHLKFTSSLVSKELETAVKEAENPKTSFSYQMEGPKVAVEVGFLEGDYTTAYDAIFQLVRKLEERFGQLETIEGLSRAKWEMQLIISKHARLQDRH